ncbi:MAG: hypothetical protein HDR04_09335 [Lachnospiraceae bacterium]|nr:hypothetical protein [Lachnospiraceae bacterium]
MEQDIFYQNDARVTRTAVKVLPWLILVFPLLIVLSAVGNIFSLLEEVQSSNQENIDHVTKEIEKLREVEQEAERIRSLQEESKEKARVAADSSSNTRERGEQILDMIKQMEDLVKSTIEQANQIVEETQTQKNVTVEVEESFIQVNQVSDNLLNISQAGKEG